MSLAWLYATSECRAWLSAGVFTCTCAEPCGNACSKHRQLCLRRDAYFVIVLHPCLDAGRLQEALPGCHTQNRETRWRAQPPANLDDSLPVAEAGVVAAREWGNEACFCNYKMLARCSPCAQPSRPAIGCSNQLLSVGHLDQPMRKSFCSSSR